MFIAEYTDRAGKNEFSGFFMLEHTLEEFIIVARKLKDMQEVITANATKDGNEPAPLRSSRRESAV